MANQRYSVSLPVEFHDELEQEAQRVGMTLSGAILRSGQLWMRLLRRTADPNVVLLLQTPDKEREIIIL
jgi:hypothetical protein